MLNRFYSYSFLLGMYIGGYTNFFSKIVISGLVIYISHPESFDIERFEPLIEKIKQTTTPYISKFYKPLGNIANLIEPPNENPVKLKITPSSTQSLPSSTQSLLSPLKNPSSLQNSKVTPSLNKK